VEDQQPDPGDLTTDAERADDAETAVGAESAAAEPPARRRRWPFGRRRPTPPAEQPQAEEPQAEPDSAESAAPSRKPVGKRTRRAAAPVTPAEPGAEPEETTDDADAGEAAVADSDDAAAAETESTAEDSDAAAEDSEAADPEPEPILVPHRPAGRRLIVAASIAAALFVGAAAFAGSQVQPYLADRAAVDTKLDIARTAAEAVTTLWTYTPDDMETLPQRSSQFLTGDFAEQYRRYIDAIVATNKQAQVSNSTEVMGTAVETLSPTEATALVYTNSVSTSPVSKNIPSLRYQSYRLTLERRDAHWMISRMNAVTNLDLSPQI
jgi:Mce-associated membrane protein